MVASLHRDSGQSGHKGLEFIVPRLPVQVE
jgi:hypothetical protein